YDGDGDLDLYVTNGPGAPNSLLSNQLRETGALTFVDVALAAGVDATDQDSAGTCFGDIDNDGDPDLVVLGTDDANRLYENRGDGTFADITARGDIGRRRTVSTSCSFGDVNGDGLLDLVVANYYTDWSTQRVLWQVPFAESVHNELFLNEGGGAFRDESAASGIETLAGFPAEGAGAAGLTWAIAMVDYDLDGDVDILEADDQGGIPPPALGGPARGFLHLFRNDGTGRFEDVAHQAGVAETGGWMGLSFGDFNCDGALDFFATNFGDFAFSVVGTVPPTPGALASRWFLGGPGGHFTDPGVGALVTTPFGWGTVAEDFDNDGDTDVLYHGGLDNTAIIELSNPGVFLRNDGCSAEFVYDPVPLASSTNHTRRVVHGVAAGDLDQDGFVDVVSVSNENAPEATVGLRPFPADFGSPFDGVARLGEVMPAVLFPLLWQWREPVLDLGTLSIEINRPNGNHWIAVELIGSAGLLPEGRANRDGIGAVVTVTPAGAKASMRPVVGGASYASQDSLAANFGLGDALTATIEVLWPGGARNRLDAVPADRVVTFPEIPCSFRDSGLTLGAYRNCVTQAIGALVAAGRMPPGAADAFLDSAVAAYLEDS
ncbi:MAG: CRTAC1 family protein, partial [Myxococcales bacterium]|nr:CRTAC1 family protein [Myxococcales bacterium]